MLFLRKCVIISTFFIFSTALYFINEFLIEKAKIKFVSDEWKRHKLPLDIYNNGKLNSSKIESDPNGIAILMMITDGSDPNNYSLAIRTVKCYAQAHGYHFVLTSDTGYGCDKNKDKFFRRHCVAAKVLSNFKALLFLDADIGVVNPKRKIEEFLDENIDVIFYNRHFNWEVAIGSYLVKNTQLARDLLLEFSEYNFKMPNSFNGYDNGGIHMFLAEKLFPNHSSQLELCRSAYENSENYKDLFTFEACIQNMFGSWTDFGKIRILRKGNGWCRDDWLTSGTWSPDRDFMLHGWKMNQMGETPENVIFQPMDNSLWYNPLDGDIQFEKCTFGNTTWRYNSNLIKSKEEVNLGLKRIEDHVRLEYFQAIGKIEELANKRKRFPFNLFY